VDGEIPNHIWIRKGFKDSVSINFPWAKKFWKRELLLKSGWKKEEKEDNFWDKEKWSDKIAKEIHPYSYILKSGEVQTRTAEIHQEKMYWKSWFGLKVKLRHCIQIEFNDEVGERSGSWKGGCVGCSFDIKRNETPLQALKRMEKERVFS